MNWTPKGSFVLCLILVANLNGWAERSARVRVEANLRITVMAYNYAKIQSEILTQAKEEAARIFKKAGIELDWLDNSVGSGEQIDFILEHDLNRIDIFLRILPGPSAFSKNNATGEASPCRKSDHPCFANVYLSRIEEQRKDGKISLGRVLGHVLAHEMGHLLGNELHSANGLMRGKWGPEDMTRAARGELLFSVEQSRRMREEWLIRARRQSDFLNPQASASEKK